MFSRMNAVYSAYVYSWHYYCTTNVVADLTIQPSKRDGCRRTRQTHTRPPHSTHTQKNVSCGQRYGHHQSYLRCGVCFGGAAAAPNDARRRFLRMPSSVLLAFRLCRHGSRCCARQSFEEVRKYESTRVFLLFVRSAVISAGRHRSCHDGWSMAFPTSSIFALCSRATRIVRKQLRVLCTC